MESIGSQSSIEYTVLEVEKCKNELLYKAIENFIMLLIGKSKMMK